MTQTGYIAGEMILAGLTAPGLVKATAFKAGKSKILSAKTGLFFCTRRFVQNLPACPILSFCFNWQTIGYHYNFMLLLLPCILHLLITKAPRSYRDNSLYEETSVIPFCMLFLFFVAGSTQDQRKKVSQSFMGDHQ